MPRMRWRTWHGVLVLSAVVLIHFAWSHLVLLRGTQSDWWEGSTTEGGFYVHRFTGCRNHVRITIAKSIVQDHTACLEQCRRKTSCHAANYNQDTTVCTLLKRGCIPERTDWDLYVLFNRGDSTHRPGRTTPPPPRPTLSPSRALSSPSPQVPQRGVSTVGRVDHLSKLRDSMLVTIVSTASSVPLMPPFNRKSRPLPEQVLRLEAYRSHDVAGWGIKCHLGMYLVAESGHLAFDRRKAKSMEHFVIEYPTDLRGNVVIRNTVSRKLVVAKNDGLLVRATTYTDPYAEFTITEVKCDPALCPFHQPIHTPPPLPHLTVLGGLPLVTSPKVVSSPEARTNQVRAFLTWKRVPQLTPVILTKDKDVASLASEYGVRVVKSGVEIHPTYDQPTYRGLFQAAFQSFPDRPFAMYTNSDIIYTPSLTETVEAILSFARKAYPDRPVFVVGQRTNVDLPHDWLPGNGSTWVREVEEYEEKGKVFQSDAEDYFLVSASLFHWDTLPDFVVGGRAFDNWFVAKVVREKRALTVDASRTILAVHQNHDKGRACGTKCSHHTAKSAYNGMLAERNGGVAKGRTTDCEYLTVRTSSGIEVVRKESLYLD